MVTCLENRIALYSPHTIYDCVKGGVADWLIKPYGRTKNIMLFPDVIENPWSLGGYLMHLMHSVFSFLCKMLVNKYNFGYLKS